MFSVVLCVLHSWHICTTFSPRFGQLALYFCMLCCDRTGLRMRPWPPPPCGSQYGAAAVPQAAMEMLTCAWTHDWLARDRYSVAGTFGQYIIMFIWRHLWCMLVMRMCGSWKCQQCNEQWPGAYMGHTGIMHCSSMHAELIVFFSISGQGIYNLLWYVFSALAQRIVCSGLLFDPLMNVAWCEVGHIATTVDI